MSTFGLTWNLKSPDRNKQFISNIPRSSGDNGIDKYLSHQFIWYNCNVTETDDDDWCANEKDGIFVMLLFSLYFICLNFASFLRAYLSACICFLNLSLMTRVWRFNAHKDYLVCIVVLITSGHYDLWRDSESKVYYYYFYIQQFCFCLWSASLHINTDVDEDDCHYNCDLLMMVILLRLLLSLIVLSPLLGLWWWLLC